MPCYEVRTMSVEFKAKHVDVLEQALKNLGWYYNINQDRVTTRGMTIWLEKNRADIQDYQQRELNELKRAYSSAAIDKVTKRNLWQRRATNETKGVLRKF